MAGYGTDQDFEAWMAANGFSVPAGAPTSAALRQRGSAYVDGRCFPGVPTGGLAQERAWPRTGAEAYGQTIAADVIPLAIEHAAYAAGYFDAANDGALTSRSSIDAGVKRKFERVEGVVQEETEYFSSGDAAADAAITIPMVEALLKPFLGDPTFPDVLVV